MLQRTLLVSWIWLLGGSFGHAEALVQGLPPDGAWTRFNVKLVIDGTEHHHTWTILCVGKKVVDGEPCRWIEMVSRAGDELEVLVKALVPETEFGMGKNPLKMARRVWFQLKGKKESEEVASIADRDVVLAMILDGPNSEVLKRPARESVPWPKGRFECDVYEGKSSITVFTNTFESAQTIWKTSEVPFGICAMKQGLKIQLGTQTTSATIDLKLNEFGNDAKSALPEIR